MWGGWRWWGEGRGIEGTHQQSAPAGSGGMGISTVQLATTAVLNRHFEGNRECHSDIISILTILFYIQQCPALSHESKHTKANTDTERQKKTLANNRISINTLTH